MVTRAFAVVSLLVLVGCSRSFSPMRPTVPQPVGTRCGGDGGVLCASGICADGVCCERSCTQTERCDALGQAGSCTSRTLGDACDAGASCPSGFCVNGVCCNRACNEACAQCDAAGTRGSCTAVPDNSDPHASCDGGCSVCYGGACTIADPGSDPRGECPVGLTCGYDQTCRPRDGGACNVDADCALGRCLSNGCMVVSHELVTVGLDPAASVRDVVVNAVTAEGDEALVVTEERYRRVRGGQQPDLMMRLLFHAAGGPWREQDLVDYSGDAQTPLAALVYQGRTLRVLTWESLDTGGQCVGARCGLHALELTATGVLLPDETIDPAAVDVTRLAAQLDASGNVTVATAEARGVYRYHRTATSWVADPVLTVPSNVRPSIFALGKLAGDPTLVLGLDPTDGGFDLAGLLVAPLSAGPELNTIGAIPCGGQVVTIRAARRQGPLGELRLGFLCGDTTGELASLAPGARTLALLQSSLSERAPSWIEGAHPETVVANLHGTRLDLSLGGLADAGTSLLASIPSVETYLLQTASAADGTVSAAVTTSSFANDGGAYAGAGVWVTRVRLGP